MRKTYFTFSLLVFFGASLFAQDTNTEAVIKLVKASKTYAEQELSGYSIELDMSAKFASAYVKDQLETYGKLMDEKDVSVIRNVILDGKKGFTIYTSTEKVLKNQSVLWLSLVQINDFQDSLTKDMLYDLALELNKRDSETQLIAKKKAYEKNLSEAISLNKKLLKTQESQKKNEQGVEATGKQLEKLNQQLGKAKKHKELYLNKRDNLEVDSDAREKADTKYEKAASKVISLQKKVTSQEKKQLNYQQGIREDEGTIKVLTGKLERNEIEKKQLEEELRKLNTKKNKLQGL